MISPRTGRLHGSLVMTIPRSDLVSTENGWKSVLLKNVNCVNLNHFPLNRLIPIEHTYNLVSNKLIEFKFPLGIDKEAEILSVCPSLFSLKVGSLSFSGAEHALFSSFS